MTKEIPWLSRFRGVFQGKLAPGELLSERTTIRIGGPAQVWAEPDGIEDVKTLIIFCREEKVPLFPIGGGSNILIRDGGIPGVSFSLTSRVFRTSEREGNRLTAGAGLPLAGLCHLGARSGLSGFESLMGIPGSVGGALVMNAGGNPRSGEYRDAGDFVEEVDVLSADGERRRLSRSEIRFGYRSSSLAAFFVLGATFLLPQDLPDQIEKRMGEFMERKRRSQDLQNPSAGCIFRNPTEGSLSAGQLVERSGLKGTRVGDAQISTIHGNFIINMGRATAAQVLELIELARARVLRDHGILLENEIRIVGEG